MNATEQEILKLDDKPLSKEKLLKKFMKEFFNFNELQKAGFFTKEMKNDYPAQAERICHFFGYKSVFEYGSEEIRCHISYAKGNRPEGEGFITIIPNIYE
jgi:hypothetical protein